MKALRSYGVIAIMLLVPGTIKAQEREGIPETLFSKNQQILGDSRVFGIAIADVDMDGGNDIFLTNYIGPSKLWLNDGNGIFSVSNQNFGNSEAHDVAIADLNSDGFPDLFLLNHSVPSKVFFNNGQGIFTDSRQNMGSAEENPVMIACGDIDLFIAGGSGAKILVNDGKGIFVQGQFLDEKWVSRVACGKLDNDNDLDIVLGKREGTGGNPIYFNEDANNQFSKKPYLGQTPPGMTPEKFAPYIVYSSGLREFSLTLSSDSTEVYFCRFGENVFPEYYMVERDRTGWTDPVHAGQGMYLTSSADGQLYTTDISALQTTGRTYLAKVSTDRGVFTRLTRIQVQPNYGTQAHPCIAPDSSYLLFDIDGGNHLFVSFRKNDGIWNRGIDLVNHGFDIKAGGAYISPDGKYLFFALNGNIWGVDIKVIENLNPFTGGISGDISPGFELHQNIPNPCHNYTRITFSLEKPSNITLDLYSNLGTRISRLINNQFYYSGRHELGFDIPNLQPGIYTYALTIGSGQTLTKKWW